MSDRSTPSPSPRPPPPPTADVPDAGVRTPDPGERDRTTLLRNANVLDVATGVVRPNTDVRIAHGRVQELGANLQADDATVVDLTERYLMPGLISLHVHPGTMVGLRMDTNGLSPERMKHDLQVWLRYGVTTVQAMGTDRDFTWDVQREQRQGEFLGARLFSVGHGFGVRNGIPPFPMDPPGPVHATEPHEIREVLEDLAVQGASGVKLWFDDGLGKFPKMAPEVAQTIIDGCGELGLPSYAHVHYVDDAKLLIGFGLQVLAHMPRDRQADRELLDLMRERGVAVIPTLTVPETLVIYANRPAFVDDPLFGRFLPPGSREYLRDEALLASIRSHPEHPVRRAELDFALRNTGLMYRAGVKIAFGTDTGVLNRVIGFYEHRELELLVQCGVSPADALRMATVTAARTLGQGNALGEIAPGRRADVVVLRANPLEHITNTRTIESVWLDGVRACGGL